MPVGKSTQTMAVKLKDLSPGETATVTGYELRDARYRRRLLAMGLTRGIEVKLLKVAPLGDPVEVEVRGFHLSLRKDEAEILSLRRIDESGQHAHADCCSGRQPQFG